MDMQELALAELTLKTFADAVKERLAEVREQMQQQMETTGASRVDATLPDGTKAGAISRSTPKATAQVVDEDLFLKWVQVHAKKNAVTRLVTEVQPAYRTALLAEMTAAGVTEAADMETGEVLPVPGVEIRTGRSLTHSARLAKGGAEAIGEAWRTGQLRHLDLPQLGAGTGGEA